MLRKIITIDQDLCNGCGACVTACHEGAIGMKDGKAVLLRDDYCDGLGDCLPVCPTNAISFEEREALAYDEDAVLANMRQKGVSPGVSPCASSGTPAGGSCPGSAMRELKPQPAHPQALRPMGCPGSAAREIQPAGCPGSMARTLSAPSSSPPSTSSSGGAKPGGSGEANNASSLRQWPVQIKLVPANAPYFTGGDVLVAADCTAFAHGGFHRSFMEGKVTLIGCPKLDEGDYADKLAAIFTRNDIRSVTVTRMSVPCCGGMERAVKTALERSGKNIPLSVITITPEGNVLG